ncbi:PREDICTED: uncharacterized protein LOC107192870 [Dufourea novaeangliae]|uniref:uncharacterized protein LOC107192870 n=1 Tax=Dufourea novaeangliae TaxID=178035 RepID=UPI000767A9E8|nr:PREDICTED: uncharacterized protein LOC107192870 [Dufourea novaeangliae]
MKGKSNKKIKKEAGKDFKSTRWQNNKKSRCFLYGSPDHNIQNCNNKSLGPKCFNCNDFGHVSTNCTKSSTPDKKLSKVSCVTSVNDRPITVKINGIDCDALVDTGSDVNLIREDVYNKVGRLKLYKVSRIFIVLGNIETRPVGKFTTDIIIGDDLFSTEIFVVPTNAMTSEVILGHALLKNTEVLIRGGSTIIKRLHPDAVTEDREDQRNTVEEAGTSEQDCEIAKLSKVFYVSECEVVAEKPYKERIENLIRDYNAKLDVETTVETKITLKCDNPISQQPRRLAPKEKKILSEQIKEWVESGIIRDP